MDETMDREVIKGSALLGVVAAVAGWLVPGLGHLILRRWSKAAVYFLCIGGLAFAGLAMRGGVFSFGAEDLFDRLGFFADLGAGAFYFLAHQIQSAGPDVAHATGDYGTRLFAAAGMLNLLTVLEAFDIGQGGQEK
ncbi:MAG TPA: DUF6677 family protein [Verrucomicrobiae bacterium]|jgi:hypothetical protein|nr:DUF6677 family protein [Verrucomicrobiae bacterium]